MFGSGYPNTDISRQKVFFFNNYCGYFIKEIPDGFPCLDNVIQTLGMLLDFRKTKNICLAPRVFLYAFLKSRATSRVFRIRVSKHGKPLGIFNLRVVWTISSIRLHRSLVRYIINTPLRYDSYLHRRSRNVLCLLIDPV